MPGQRLLIDDSTRCAVQNFFVGLHRQDFAHKRQFCRRSESPTTLLQNREKRPQFWSHLAALTPHNNF